MVLRYKAITVNQWCLEAEGNKTRHQTPQTFGLALCELGCGDDLILFHQNPLLRVRWQWFCNLL